MAVSVKMGVDIGGFKSGIKEGQQILKSLDAEMKVAEAEFKATGNAENMLAQKTKTLTSQLNIQKSIMEQAQSAMKAMTDAGIKPTDAAYQKLNVQMLNAQAGMLQAQAALNGLDGSQQEAAASADALSQSMNSIGKKISLDQVISGIDRITGGLEKAAKKAVELGQDIWNSIMDSAKWADDTATMAQMYGIDVETFQQMQKLVAGGLDTTVDAMLKSQSKLKKGIGAESKEVMADLEELGLAFTQTGKNGETFSQMVTEDSVDLFFRAGQALMNLGDEFKQEDMAQRLFGKSWHELVPLFSEYKTVEEYNKALEEQRVTSEEDVDALVALNDKVGELKSNFDTLKNDVMASLAPALTSAADALNGLLTSVMDYLKTEKGQKALDDLSKAVSGLFDDLGKISPEEVVSGFSAVFNDIVSGITWISDNWESVKAGIEAIAGAFVTMKLGSVALNIGKIVKGFQTLWSGANNPLPSMSGADAAAGAGASTGSGFVGTVAKTAPYLAPAILFIDGMIHDQQTLADMYAKGEESMRRTELFKEANSGHELFNIWDTLNDYLTISGDSVTDKAKMDAFGERYLRWLNDEITDTSFDRLADLMTQEEWDAFNEAVKDYMNGKDLSNDEDRKAYTDALQKALELVEGDMVDVEVEPVVPENAADTIAKQIGDVPISIMIPPGLRDVLGLYGTGFANGLPNVPNDGLYRLHAGEQVVPAREVQNRSYNSNLYVESMYMNNGQDAEGLAAAMAAANRRTMSGFGC